MKPLRAVKNPKLSDIVFPIITHPKYNGIRCLIIKGKAVTANLKPLKNDHIREYLENHCPNGFDGEVVLEPPGTLTKEGQPPFKYIVFDFVQLSIEKEYSDRLTDLQNIMECNTSPHIILAPLEYYRTGNEESLKEVIKNHRELGFNGSFIRSDNSSYKTGNLYLFHKWYKL